MQLISSRIIPFIDSQSLSESQAREALLHDNRSGFILYLSSGGPRSATEERVLFLEPREALIWLNEPPEERVGGGDQGETSATIRMRLRRWGRTEGRA